MVVLLSGQRAAGDDSTVAAGITVSAGAQHVKGSYTELIASTGFYATGFFISFGVYTTSADFLIDIAYGVGGSEQIVVANLLHSLTVVLEEAEVFIPIIVPVGTRISARVQSTDGSATIRMSVVIQAGGVLGSGMQLCTTYGDNPADSGGVSVDPGGVANTYGAYSEIIASTTRVIKKLIVGLGNQDNVSTVTASWKIDIAINVGGSENPCIPRLQSVGYGTTFHITPSFRVIEIDIPIGSRISVRAMCSSTDATDRLFDVVLIGVC